MATWSSLFKKEVRLGLPAYIFTWVGFIVMVGIGVFFGVKADQPLAGAAVAAILLAGAHVFYLACYMLYSLQSERKKMHLWLHTPRSSYTLLTTKLLAGLLGMLITLFLSCLIILITFLSTKNLGEIVDSFTFQQFMSSGLTIVINIVLFSLDLAIWLTFFWVFYRVIFTWFGTFISSVINVVVIIGLFYALARFELTALYSSLTHWGKISTPDVPTGFHFTISSTFAADAGAETSSFFYLGTYVFEAVIALILFIITCKLLDKKVEV